MQKDRKSREEWNQNFPFRTGAGYEVNTLTGVVDGQGFQETQMEAEFLLRQRFSKASSPICRCLYIHMT